MEIFCKYVLEQIDFGTLVILFCLMGVVEGFNKLGYLNLLSNKLVSIAGSYKVLMGTLIYVCFFLSMFVTNDVGLIIIVPFTIQIVGKIVESKALIKIIVLETIAANLGCMVTPIGNPQNLYLYQYYDLDLSVFAKVIMPYAILAAVILFVLVMFDKTKVDIKTVKVDDNCNDLLLGNKKGKIIKTVIYSILFILSILTVLDVIHYAVCFFLVIVCMVLCDRSLFKGINYSLLIKFVILFLIVGNLAEIPIINSKLKTIVVGNEFISGIVLSQFLSNMPTAIMLSKFTKNGTELLLGVDIGGLGTLIASMASMISYDYYVKAEGADKKKYILSFTGYSIIFLLGMLLLKLLL
ncbi:MAG: hypothetical protein IJA34_17295 [Lachnospiraceae bacterium]|nr:hypothetical protein [Lachnospiraceae bacterium]